MLELNGKVHKQAQTATDYRLKNAVWKNQDNRRFCLAKGTRRKHRIILFFVKEPRNKHMLSEKETPAKECLEWP